MKRFLAILLSVFILVFTGCASIPQEKGNVTKVSYLANVNEVRIDKIRDVLICNGFQSEFIDDPYIFDIETNEKISNLLWEKYQFPVIETDLGKTFIILWGPYLKKDYDGLAITGNFLDALGSGLSGRNYNPTPMYEEKIENGYILCWK